MKKDIKLIALLNAISEVADRLNHDRVSQIAKIMSLCESEGLSYETLIWTLRCRDLISDDELEQLLS